jgi:hypothetical protein
MKKQSNMLSVALSEIDFVNFSDEVTETTSAALTEHGNKIFTISDLWNIRRKIKATTIRRYL